MQREVIFFFFVFTGGFSELTVRVLYKSKQWGEKGIKGFDHNMFIYCYSRLMKEQRSIGRKL